MSNRFHGQSGEQVIGGLKQHLGETAQKLRGHVGRDDLQPDWRRRIRNEAIADARRAEQEAKEAFATWAARKRDEARGELAAGPWRRRSARASRSSCGRAE